MGKDGTALDGEAAALVRTDAEPGLAPQWLVELKAAAEVMKQNRERPPGKPFGRWLGDFLDQETESGLLPAEEKLLAAASNGEACTLINRAVPLWETFEAWRNAIPEWDEGDLGFVEAIARFTEAQPEPVQDVIIEATRYAIETLRLPPYWEPKNAADVEKFASAQRAFLNRLEAEAYPAKAVEQARRDPNFYHLAVEAAVAALAPKPYQPLKLSQQWLSPLLQRNPLPAAIREKIEDKPHILQGFFEELIKTVKRTEETGRPEFLNQLKHDPSALQDCFDAVFARFERQHWRRVDATGPDVLIRARFLRFLALGGDESAPVHERGINLRGAAIADDLDLTGATMTHQLSFIGCRFARRVVLRDAASRSLNLSGSHVEAIDAVNAHIRGDVVLQDGFQASGGAFFANAAIDRRFSASGGAFFANGAGALDLGAARIGGNVNLDKGFWAEGEVTLATARAAGDVDCSGAVFLNRSADGKSVALECRAAEISGDVLLTNGFRAEGAVSFSDAKVGGALQGQNGWLVNITSDGAGRALDCETAAIKGSTHLSDGFAAHGLVTFHDARLGGDLICAGGSFDNASRDEAAQRHAAAALDLTAADIKGVLWLERRVKAKRLKAQIRGSVKLDRCQVRALADGPASWPSPKIRTSAGRKLRAFISLDGFTYGRLAGDDSLASRKAWLDRQPPQHLGVSFRPQPFHQLAKVYHEAGEGDKARTIAKFREHRRFGGSFAKLWHDWWKPPKLFAAPLEAVNYAVWPVAVAWRAIFGVAESIVLAAIWAFVRFGTAYWRGWGRLAVFALFVVAASGLFYQEIAVQGGFAPSNPALSLNKELAAKCAKNWTACEALPADLPAFNPFLYALDTTLPMADLGQKSNWQPIDRAGKPIVMVFPKLVRDEGDLFPRLIIEERPLAAGSVERIARWQGFLGWGMLALLLVILARAIRGD